MQYGRGNILQIVEAAAVQHKREEWKSLLLLTLDQMQVGHRRYPLWLRLCQCNVQPAEQPFTVTEAALILRNVSNYLSLRFYHSSPPCVLARLVLVSLAIRALYNEQFKCGSLCRFPPPPLVL